MRFLIDVPFNQKDSGCSENKMADLDSTDQACGSICGIGEDVFAQLLAYFEGPWAGEGNNLKSQFLTMTTTTEQPDMLALSPEESLSGPLEPSQNHK